MSTVWCPTEGFSSAPCKPSGTRRARPPFLSRQFQRRFVLVAGGDDALWPSLDFAHSIVRRRKDAGKITRLVSAPDAGHRILLPGENTPRSKAHAHGGNDDADARLGQ